MAPKSKFLLKDSPPEVIAASGGTPKGRTYDAEYAKKPGGIRVDDLVMGMKLASLAITDDKPNTLKNTAKTNPWQEEALTMITGSREAAHRPLSEILKSLYNLDLDCHIDISGIKQGRALDTQGFIAHNDEMIVLSYRCTTSALDWITNLSTTSSEWEPDVDIELDSMFGAYVRGGLQAADSFYPYVALGYTRGEVTASVPGFSTSESESDISFGFGADVDINKKLTLNIEYMNYFDKDGTEVDGFSFGVVTKF